MKWWFFSAGAAAFIVLSVFVYYFWADGLRAQVTKDAGLKEAYSEESLAYLREHLFDNETIAQIVNEKSVGRAFKGRAYDEMFHDTPLRPFDRAGMTRFTKIVGIQIVVVPLQADKEGRKDSFPVGNPVQLFGLVGRDKVIVPDIFSQFAEQLPPTLDDGRSYTLEFNAVMLPTSGVENSQFQEPLGSVVYPRKNSAGENRVPVLVFSRTRKILATPSNEWPVVASASAMGEGVELYQSFSLTGAVKSVGARVIENLPDGAILFEGNFDSPVIGGILFTQNGLPAAIVAERVSEHVGAAVPLEHVLDALRSEGVIKEYEKVE